MKNIVLIGMPGSGKTTFGRALSEILARTFIDADEYLENKEKRTIKSFFAESEKAFRDAEERTIIDLSGRQNLIIATGGGVVKRNQNVERLHQTGLILFIDRKPEDIITDVEVGTRPLLADGPQKVYDLYQERIALYRDAADEILSNTGSEKEVLAGLMEIIHKYHLD